MSILQNTCKPKGLAGKLMLNSMNMGHAAMAKWGLEHISVGEKDWILDIGCGGGANVKRFLELASEGYVKGIDYSNVSVEKTRKVNKAAIDNGRCEILHGNVMKLPFLEGTFHLVSAFETIYFWPDIEKAFEQVYKVLKENGTFMICNESDGSNPSDEKWVKKIDGMRVYNAKTIEQALKKAGFSDIKCDQNQKHWICITAQKSK